MTISAREKTMAALTIMAVLFGVLGMMAGGRLRTWKLKREEYRQTVRRVEQEKTLIAQRAQWEKRYAGVKDLMPSFPADQPVDTHWLGVMDQAATKNGLNIAKRQVAPEKPVGDVYEITIECKAWEGSLDALVHFLYDLDSAGLMIDIRQAFMRPHPSNRGLLRGTFPLNCAYMREKPASPAPAEHGGKARKKTR
jgi:hypothetical protein